MTPDAQPAPAPTHATRAVVLFDVTWARWGPLPLEEPENQPWERHRRWLTRLLGDAGEETGASLLPGPAAEGAVWVTAPDPVVGATVSELVSELARCSQAYENRDALASDVEVALNRAAHRVHLPLWALARRLDLTGDHLRDRDEHACLDLRWRHHLGAYWLYATVSLWSARPVEPGFAPTADDEAAPPASEPDRVPEIRERFESVAGAVHARLLDEFTSVASTVLDEARPDVPRSYRPPRFWASFCDAATERHSTWCAAAEHLARAALEVPSPAVAALARDTLVARSTLDAAAVPVTVLRGHHPIVDGTRPTYLLLPGRAETGEGREGRAARERVVGELAGHLTDVESAIAAQLLDVTTDLDIDHRFGRLHAALADKGSRLWDTLALDLPARQGRDLDQLHRLVELVHLTLLQGLADLQRLRASSARTVAALDAASVRSLTGLDAHYVSTATTAPARSITTALRDEGYVGPTRRWADGVARDTAGVLEQVTSLLGAITQAFDERRVRDTDKVGRAGLLLAVGLGAVGFLTETYGHLLEAWESATGRDLTTLFGAMLAVVLATALLSRRVWVRRHGHLSVTSRFRRLYPQVRGYAAICRHEKLEEVRRLAWIQAGEGVTDVVTRRHRYHAEWNRTDRRLAGTFARLVDCVQTTTRHERDGSALRHLRVEVEQWTLFSILVAERPRAFYVYPLPRLTLLYRFFPVLGRGFDLAGPDGDQPALISDGDLLLMLRAQCGAELAHLATVTAWGAMLTRRARRDMLDARAVLRIIEESGIRAGMSRREWNEVHSRLAAAVAAEAGGESSPPAAGA